MNIEAAKLSPTAAISGPKCILAAVPAQATFTETPAPLRAINLAAEHRASLSLYILSPSPQAPSASTGGSASARLRRKQARFERQVSAATKAASRLASLTGVDFVIERARSPFEGRNERFVQLARMPGALAWYFDVDFMREVHE